LQTTNSIAGGGIKCLSDQWKTRGAFRKPVWKQ